MTTLRDVAALAGVSAMTVSNVVNGREDKVSAATRKRVHEAIRTLGYVPNAQARALAGASSRVLALVYEAVPGRSALAAPYESLFVGACERAARGAGYALMLCGSSDEREMVGQLRSWNVDGAVVMATVRMTPAEFLDLAGVPGVFIDVHDAPGGITRVDVDDRGGARTVGRRLACLGHRRVAFVGPDAAGSAVVRERLDGLREGLVRGRRGERTRRVEVIRADVGFDEGLAVGARLASRGTDRPSAVFASGDVLALGVVSGLRGRGLAVPGDVSVVGFDGLEIGRYGEPSLTTVAQPVERKAEEAVTRLVHEVEGGEPGGAVVLPVTWREGGTLAPPPPRRS